MILVYELLKLAHLFALLLKYVILLKKEKSNEFNMIQMIVNALIEKQSPHYTMTDEDEKIY